MTFIAGLVVWLVIGLVGGFLARAMYAGPATGMGLTLTFGVFGAFVGGMLGMSAYVFHDPVPLRAGGLLGAVLGATFFSFLYHFIARKVV